MAILELSRPNQELDWLAVSGRKRFVHMGTDPKPSAHCHRSGRNEGRESDMRMKGILVAAIGFLGACCGAPISVWFQGVIPMNVNEKGKSTSVQLLIFQLSNDSNFGEATAESLWTDYRKVLRDELVAVTSVMVEPGADVDKPQEVWLGNLPGPVRFLGFLANFSKEDEMGSRKLLLKRDQALGVLLRLTGYHMAPRR